LARGRTCLEVSLLVYLLYHYVVKPLWHYLIIVSAPAASDKTMWQGVFPTVAAAAGLLVAGSTSATRLYVTSYAGTVTTLDLVEGRSNGKHGGATSKLETVATTTACGANPSWLALDYSKSFLYCLDEAWGQTNGAVTSFYTSSNGSLTPIAEVELVAGPVSIAEFGVGGSGLAIAS
jgi:hypothetical protein